MFNIVSKNNMSHSSSSSITAGRDQMAKSTFGGAQQKRIPLPNAMPLPNSAPAMQYNKPKQWSASQTVNSPTSTAQILKAVNRD